MKASRIFAGSLVIAEVVLAAGISPWLSVLKAKFKAILRL